MGSCISKCKPKSIKKQQPRFDFNNLIQDNKLIIIPQPPQLTTTAATTNNPVLSLNNKISPYPPSPTSSISTTITTTPNNSSSASTPRRSLTFSDETFLWPCYNQNPHVVRVNSLKASAFLPPGIKPVSPVVRYSSPQRVLRSAPQKRVRPTSPLPIRQKSFKKERSGLSIRE